MSDELHGVATLDEAIAQAKSADKLVLLDFFKPT